MTILTEIAKFASSEAYAALMTSLREKYLREFENSNLSQHAERQHAWVMLRAIKDLDTQIVKYVNELKISQITRG